MKPEAHAQIPPEDPASRPALTDADAKADLEGKPRPKRGAKKKPAKAVKPTAPERAKRTVRRFSLLQWIVAQEKERSLPMGLALEAMGDAFAVELRAELSAKPLDLEALRHRRDLALQKFEALAKTIRDAEARSEGGSVNVDRLLGMARAIDAGRLAARATAPTYAPLPGTPTS